MGLGVQRTQYAHSVPIGQHNGRANVAADVRRLGNHMEVLEPVNTHDACQPHIVSWCMDGVESSCTAERLRVGLASHQSCR